MTFVVLLRGVNVGGHRRFRPSLLVEQLKPLKVISIGTAGTFVVTGAARATSVRDAFRRRLPFATHIALCLGRDLLNRMQEHPFPRESPPPGNVRFVSVLCQPASKQAVLPVYLPDRNQCLVTVMAKSGPFVFGEYRRHMRVIGCLGKIDDLFGVPVTTRNWSTVSAIRNVLESRAN